MPSKVSVEDLLHLKRSERPEPEFWTEFERTLRQKQLAALVEKRSWWHGLTAAYSRLGRLGLPLGAAAILALTFVASRNRLGMQSEVAAAGRENTSRPEVAPAALPSGDVQAREDRGATTALSRPKPAEEPAPTSADKSPVMVAATTAGNSHPAVTPVSWLEDVLDDRAGRTDAASSERSVAFNLATLAPVEPDLVDVVARPLGFEERALPLARPPHSAEMLPTAVAVTEPRRTRLLASLASAGVYTPEPSAPEHARRSVLRYLAEDGWDRSMSRLEAEGDKLSIKF